jgi:hypothetical protein
MDNKQRMIMKTLKDLAAAAVAAVLIGGPFAYYFAFVMTP